MLGRPYPNAFPTILLASLVPLYYVIGLEMPGRTLFVPEVALDRAVPLVPAWILVYTSLWVFAFLPVLIVREKELRRRTVRAYLIVVIVSYVGFLVYPTVGPRPPGVIGEGFFAWSLRYLYSFDPPYNCFPSLHVAYAFVAALSCHRVHRGLGAVAVLWASVIGVSTLFTRQHYLADVIAGTLVAYVAHVVFLRGHPRVAITELDRRLAPARALCVIPIFGIMVGCFWVAYQMRGW